MKYTFLASRGEECKLSRIDRVLVCSNVFNKWPNACVRALHRDLSDHSPLVLSLVDTTYGAKPFLWFDSWLDRAGCEELVTNVMKGCDFLGPPDVALVRKLQELINRLRGWIKKCRIKEDEDLARLKNEKEDYEIVMEDRDLEEEEVWIWSECRKSIEEIERHRSRDIKQKSRVKRASHGDENTAFFHSMVNGRKARNTIPGLEVNGE
ncbi:uncharacterized protein LOC143592607 [Bidens hawaiensis]|uniref:uncharacterized protein LOC143592607 n=1 Tax=Bidens hawaiensis TaxID=980011 RepID=UPI00404A7EE6